MGAFYSQLFVTPAYPAIPFTDQTVIVTGSNSIEKTTDRIGVCEVWELDLASFESVKLFAERALKLPRLDILVENAGIATYTFDTAEGHERTITINVISTFPLGLLLLPKLKATAKEFPSSTPHLSIVTSDVHAWTSFPEWKTANTFVALNDKETADMQARYPTSKLEVLVVRELSSKLAGSGVIMNMLTPGLCKSQLSREAGLGFRLMILLFARSTEVAVGPYSPPPQQVRKAMMTTAKFFEMHISQITMSPDDRVETQPQSEDVTPDVLDWDGPDDSANPVNWPSSKKTSHIVLIALVQLVSYVLLERLFFSIAHSLPSGTLRRPCLPQRVKA
ncbi:hypothetical protein CNMCM5623_005661 [Aspergillus felis]|uniref:Short-chain dehydrogenase n=1 Tax=Aspergillus felis TaxID=1287682 RepID=A0A8H6PU84_9EURO|nr:hypothetical protein CNMCM5623_005661 [Aspergillus felis]